MDCLVAIDDTDMPGTAGTGRLVQELCGILQAEDWGIPSAVSRHQLFVHEAIPFTSHNSALCFEFSLTGGHLSDLTSYVAGFLEERYVQGSDPGLCIAGMSNGLDRSLLIRFGRRAKCRVLEKSEAVTVAAATGIHLSEHGGGGLGVIGAVAGIGLRLAGNDGRYRGWYHLGNPGDVIAVGALSDYGFAGSVMTLGGRLLDPEERLVVGSRRTKAVRLNSQPVILACECGPDTSGAPVSLRTLTSREAKAY